MAHYGQCFQSSMKRKLPEDPVVPALSLKELAIHASLPIERVKDIVQYTYDHTYVYYIKHDKPSRFKVRDIQHFKKVLVFDERELLDFMLKDDYVVANLFIKHVNHESGYSKRFTELKSKLRMDGIRECYNVVHEHLQSSEKKIATAVRDVFTKKELAEFIWGSRSTISIFRLSDFKKMELRHTCDHDLSTLDSCSMECDVELFHRVPFTLQCDTQPFEV